MIDHLLLFAKYNKLYFITGAILLVLLLLPTKEKLSGKTANFLYIAIVVWAVCLGYRLYTGQDIIHLLDRNDGYIAEERSPGTVQGPFNKYYSNDAGREPKDISR